MVPENIHTPPTNAIGNSWEEEGSQRAKNLKHEAKLEFLEGWGGGGHRANPFREGGGGGMDIFWNHTLSKEYYFGVYS